MDFLAVEFRPFRAGLYFDVQTHRALPWAFTLRPVGAKGKKPGARNQGQSPRDSVAFIHKRVEAPFDKKPGTVPAQQGESPRCRVFLRRLQLAESGASTSVSSYLQV
jgi:hypothetical protein